MREAAQQRHLLNLATDCLGDGDQRLGLDERWRNDFMDLSYRLLKQGRGNEAIRASDMAKTLAWRRKFEGA